MWLHLLMAGGSALVALLLGAVGVFIWHRHEKRRTDAALAAQTAQADSEERRRLASERALAVRNEQYAALFHNTQDMVFIFPVVGDNMPGAFIEVNRTACARLEYTAEDLQALSIVDIEASDLPATIPGVNAAELLMLTEREIEERRNTLAKLPYRNLIANVITDKSLRFNRMFQTRTGSRIPVEVAASHFVLAGRSMILCTARDITERRKVERALKESEKRFREFFEYSPIGVALYDDQKQLINVNLSCLKILGAPDRQEFVRFNVFESPFLPESARRLLERGETGQFELTVDFDKVRTGDMYLTTHRGRAHLNVLVQNLGLDEEFRPRGYLVQIEDITKRRQAEAALRRSERQLLQSQKMEALGTLAGGIAHDFNNILTPILGYTEIMMHSTSKSEQAYEFLSEIHKASYRAKDLVQQILSFSRQAAQESQPIHIIPIVKEALKLQAASLPPNIRSQCITKTERDVVMGNPTQIHQVIMNLCANAVYAMKENGGTLELIVTEFTVRQRTPLLYKDLAPGRYLRISVRDSGVGMDEETSQRIFEPFFTTKPSGEGTGMGLAVVHGIVSSLRGTVSVESEPGRGTTFHVVLPLVEDVTTETPTERQAAMTGGAAGAECILCVDDEPDVVRMTARMLSLLGYDVRTSVSSREALELFRATPERFDMIITDQVMPGLTGRELAAEIRAIRPAIPLLLCTGYADDFTADQAAAEGFHSVLRKPIVMRELADAVRGALDRQKNAAAAPSA